MSDVSLQDTSRYPEDQQQSSASASFSSSSFRDNTYLRKAVDCRKTESTWPHSIFHAGKQAAFEASTVAIVTSSGTFFLLALYDYLACLAEAASY